MDTEPSPTPYGPRDGSSAAAPAHQAVGALTMYAAAIAHRREAGALRHEARSALSRYVEQLKTERVPPERALVMVKVVAQSLGSGMGIGARDDLVSETVRWFIEAYFRTQSRGAEASQATSS